MCTNFHQLTRSGTHSFAFTFVSINVLKANAKFKYVANFKYPRACNELTKLTGTKHAILMLHGRLSHNPYVSLCTKFSNVPNLL